jgi:hypothetical protein
MRVMFPPA